MRLSQVIIWLLLLVIVGIQFISVERENPPITNDLKAPPEVKSILKDACYDCHSNETKWPWYSYIAPVKFLVADHVKEGREHLNFSEWKSEYSSSIDKDKKEIWKEIERGSMPIYSYTLLHSKADLSPLQRQVIKNWVNSN